MTPDDMREAAEKATDDILDLLEAQEALYAPAGVAFDQEKITSDAEFMAWVDDMAQRPSPEFNTLAFLAQVAPHVYTQIMTRYNRATGRRVLGAR